MDTLPDSVYLKVLKAHLKQSIKLYGLNNPLQQNALKVKIKELEEKIKKNEK